MSTAHKLPHSTTVDRVHLDDVRGRVVDFRHNTGVLADLRRTGTDLYEITLVLGGGDDSERIVIAGVRSGESLHLHT